MFSLFLFLAPAFVNFPFSFCSLDPRDYKMIITYGKPLNYTTPTVFTMSFEDCVQKCWNDTTCVLVYDTSPTCQIFVLANITSVQKLNSSSRSRIAFRKYSPSQRCPIAPKEDILVGGTVVGRTYFTLMNIWPTYQEFNLTLENNIWKFQSSVFWMCFMGYIPLKRDDDIMCMLIFQSETCINQSQAVTDCATRNSHTLLGVANMAEFNFISNAAVGLILTQPMDRKYANLGFWMDGVRKNSCKYPNTRSESCNGTNEFKFSDTSAPNPVFQWLPGQPNGLLNNPPDSNCIYLKVSNNESPGVDDMPCSITQDSASNMCYNGYLCGCYADPRYT